jgi:hypothetical protein
MTDQTLYLHFEFDADADSRALTEELATALASLDGVADADAVVEQQRLTGAEIVAAIAVGVLLVRGAKELLQEVNRLLPEIARVARNIKGLRTGYVEVDGKQVRLSDVTDDDVEQLAK